KKDGETTRTQTLPLESALTSVIQNSAFDVIVRRNFTARIAGVVGTINEGTSTSRRQYVPKTERSASVAERTGTNRFRENRPSAMPRTLPKLPSSKPNTDLLQWPRNISDLRSSNSEMNNNKKK